MCVCVSVCLSAFVSGLIGDACGLIGDACGQIGCACVLIRGTFVSVPAERRCICVCIHKYSTVINTCI